MKINLTSSNKTNYWLAKTATSNIVIEAISNAMPDLNIAYIYNTTLNIEEWEVWLGNKPRTITMQSYMQKDTRVMQVDGITCYSLETTCNLLNDLLEGDN